MAITLERCEGYTFVARSGPEHEDYGDPYDMACTVELEGTVAIIKGLAARKKVTRGILRELCDILKDMGITMVRIERIRNGRVTQHDWSIS